VDAVYSADRTRMLFASDRFGSGNLISSWLTLTAESGAAHHRSVGISSRPGPDGAHVVLSRGGAGPVSLCQKIDGGEAASPPAARWRGAAGGLSRRAAWRSPVIPAPDGRDRPTPRPRRRQAVAVTTTRDRRRASVLLRQRRTRVGGAAQGQE
jgi:hypothetical protein